MLWLPINSDLTPKVLLMKQLGLLSLENKLWRPATPDDAIPEPVDANAEIVEQLENQTVKHWLCKALELTSYKVRNILEFFGLHGESWRDMPNRPVWAATYRMVPCFRITTLLEDTTDRVLIAETTTGSTYEHLKLNPSQLWAFKTGPLRTQNLNNAEHPSMYCLHPTSFQSVSQDRSRSYRADTKWSSRTKTQLFLQMHNGKVEFWAPAVR